MYKLNSTQIQQAIKKAATKLLSYCQKHNLHYTITGVSGGLDSAVTLALAEQASIYAQNEKYKLHHIGLILPCYSHPTHTKRGEEVIKKFHAHRIKVELSPVFENIQDTILSSVEFQVNNILKKTNGHKITAQDRIVGHGNIKARLRLILGTYHIARMMHGIVLSTDNYSEMLMGFWTLCGDVGDFSMIQNVFKGIELYDIARSLNVPQSVLDAPPDDGLGIKQGGDEAQLGVDYRTLDTIMIKLINQGFHPDKIDKLPLQILKSFKIKPKIVQSVWNRSVMTRYKRKGTIILKRKDLGLPSINEINI